MMEKKNISLDKIDKKLPFTVPENYFEDFAARMELQVAGETLQPPHRRVLNWRVAVAAVFAGILLAGALYATIFKNASKSDNYESYVLSQVDESSMLYYYVGEPTTETK